LGKGSVYSTSTKHKLNARSSTEGELISIHDVMPTIEWTNHFLEHQGFQVTDTLVYQDNLSTMLLAKNGKASSSRRTKHIHVRYFYVKDRVDSGAVRIEYCPTEMMLADFFTKPLQGAQFRKLRDLIMNVDSDDAHHANRRSVLGHESEHESELSVNQANDEEQTTLKRNPDDEKEMNQREVIYEKEKE
jgi:hypothetical protein